MPDAGLGAPSALQVRAPELDDITPNATLRENDTSNIIKASKERHGMAKKQKTTQTHMDFMNTLPRSCLHVVDLNHYGVTLR